MDLRMEAFSLFLYVFCVGYYTEIEGFQLCTLGSKAIDDGLCSSSLGLSPVCLVCPISRVGQKGLAWKSSNETLFIETVRLTGDLNTYAVNKCGPDNYTLSVSTTNISNGGQYICTLGMTTLAQFNLIIKDLKPIIPNTQLCIHDFNSKGDNPCKVVLHSSPVCLVCPVKRKGSNGLSWKYSNNVTLFLGEVRTGKMFNTSVNQCGQENYSLSLLPNDVDDGGHFTCYLGETSLARFKVIIMAAISQMYLGCQNESGHCKSELQYNTTMLFECWVAEPQSSLTLSWYVDNRILSSSQYQDINGSFPRNITSFLQHTFIGNERSLSCQVNGSHIVSAKETLHFSPIPKVTPELLIFWNGTRVVNSVEIYDKTTVEARCEVTNLRLPVTLSWEVDNQEKFSKEVNFWREPLQNSKIHNMTRRNATGDVLYNPMKEVYINFNFTPTDYSHNIGCVVKGPFVFGRKASVLLTLNQKMEEDSSYSLMIWIVLLIPIVSLVVFCVVSMRKGLSAVAWHESKQCYSQRLGGDLSPLLVRHLKKAPSVVVFPKKTVASSSGHSERITETPQSQQDYTPEEMYMAEKTPDYDIYYGTDNSESLSNFVRLINRISEKGHLERWVGELSGMVYDKDYCVASTYNDDASDIDISDFRTLAMHVKDVVNHDNVTEIIGIEVSKEPFYIYTEHIEMGTLKEFLNDLQSSRVDPSRYLGELLRFSKEVSSALVYLKSAELSHPAICCEKVLLTEGGTCKVYDFQSYPVPENILFYIVLKNEQSCSNWRLAPETRLEKEHSFKSDSWSLSAFICEVYSMGTDPCKAARNSLYDVPANYYDVSFRRPHECPDSIYATLKSGWNLDKTERPDIESIYKSLTTMTS